MRVITEDSPSTIERLSRFASMKLPQFRIAENAIDAKHQASGGDGGFLGPAIEGLGGCPDGRGYFKRYQRGMIYWSPSTKAQEVHGPIFDKWAKLGFEQSILGYPTDGQHPTGDGLGAFARFERGVIFWKPEHGANEVQGKIHEKWASLGFEQSFLGYPIEDGHNTPDGFGRFNRFENGMIYWNPVTGAHAIHGDILDRWSVLGFERSWLGYPTSDVQDFSTDGGLVATFERGSIYWWPDADFRKLNAIDVEDVSVAYTGLMCFGETDSDGPDFADEPYVLMGVVSPTNTPSKVMGSTFTGGVYTGVNGGEDRPDLIELYRGKPYGLLIGVTLMERDNGNLAKYQGLVRDGVQKVVQKGSQELNLIPEFGPEIASTLEPYLNDIASDIAGAITNFLGMKDDSQLGHCVMYFSPRDLVIATHKDNQLQNHIGYKESTPMFTGEGSSYKAYFGIVKA